MLPGLFLSLGLGMAWTLMTHATESAGAWSTRLSSTPHQGLLPHQKPCPPAGVREVRLGRAVGDKQTCLNIGRARAEDKQASQTMGLHVQVLKPPTVT